MAEYDPQTTQRDVVPDIGAELVAAGFADPVLIGQGGYGAVYRCTQSALERDVAVKVLTDHLDEENLERFVREQRAMGRLSGHPNIVNILEVGATPDGFPFIVMQYHPHASLDGRIRKHGPLDWQDVLRLGVRVAGALETAHRAGTLHRDIKPGNILLTEYGEPQLTDFGIARISGGFETGADMVTGSPAFTAPELLAGVAPSVSSDVYGLGATMFCAMTGHAAFERRSGEQVVAHFLRVASEPIPDLTAAGFPAELSQVIEHAMAREPEDRPASVAAFGEELREVQRALGVPVSDMALPLGQAADPLTVSGERKRSGITTAPPTPSTKFRPPLRPRAQVPRARLMEILRAGDRRRFVLIHAPAGYGKTTVAVQWAEELVRDGVKVAWLTVDHDDNDVARFLTNLVESIGRADSEVITDLPDVIDEHGARAEQYVLTSLINEIHARHQRMAIVIDDWHRVSDAGVVAAMVYLLEHGCHHLQVIVTSRNRARLPVSRMRVCDELVEIDIAGLCFDAGEAQSFLRDVAGLELHNDEITNLRNSTDGWVAALQLACVSLRASDEPAELISHISGRHQAIGDFLAENVLGTLEPEMLKFLLSVSVPERICAGLATVLSGQARGQALLEEVESRDLFLRRVDQEGDWFRFHPLFAEFLRRRLERDEPQLITTLHRDASAWFADHAMLSEAVDHALAAGDIYRAIELVEDDGQVLIENSQMSALLTLVDKLPPQIVITNPRLQLLLAWSNVLLHRISAAQQALTRVSAALSGLPPDDPTVAEIRMEADVAEACIRATSDHVEGIDELIEESVAKADMLPPFVVSAVGNIATVSSTFRFDFEESHRWQRWASPYHGENTGPYASMYGYALDGLAHFEQLHLDEAESCCRAALAVSTRKGSSSQSQGARLASALLAEVLYERGEIAESTLMLDDSFGIGAAEGVVDMIKARHLIGARLALLRGDRAAAATYLDDAIDIAEKIDAPRLRAYVENEQVTRRVPSRRGVRARITWQDKVPTTGVAAIVAQLDTETAVRLLLDEDPERTAERACLWVDAWADRLRPTGRSRAIVRVERLRAACLSAAGRRDEALASALFVLDRCAAAGLARYPMDGGDVFRTLVEDIRDGAVATSAATAAYLTRVFAVEGASTG